ncbi:MAG TPA: PAS domain S-box protein, partial [Stellaceae bacterium]|nr:PAS domain S-box protein [Stellaceae bacterium]
MSARADELQARYRRALAAYMERDNETALLSALDLGKAALAEGRSLLDLVAAHNRFLPNFIARAPTDADVKKRFSRAEEFLAQVVAPYDMANRGWVEVVARLRAMNETLEELVGERTSALRASEQRFRDITESAGDWIWETDADHRFTFFVGQSLETMAIPPEAVLGKTWWELATADLDHDQAWERYKRAMDAHQPLRRFHQIIATPVGTRLYISTSGKPMVDENGAFHGYRGTATDETVIINAHHRTEQAETLLRDAIESLYEGIVIFDKAERLVSSNRAFRDMHAPCAEVLHAGATVEALLRDALAKGLYPDAIGREPTWLEERLGRYRHPAGATEHRFHGGRWLFVAERRMSNGGTAGLYIDITELKRVQAALGESEERLDRAQRIAGIGSWELDIRSGEFIWSKEMYRLRGLPPGAQTPTLERFVANAHDEDRGRLQEWLDRLRVGEAVPPIEYRRQRADDEMRIVVAEGQAIANAVGRIFKIAGTLQDVTERRSVEGQLAHAQKMEAIGNLTGGMAHDFNNLLGVIIGNLDLLRERHGGNAEIDELAREALDAAKRGADLTRGLLAFARRQPLHSRRIAVNEVVSEITKLMRRTLGERIDVVLDLAPEVWPVVVDPAQLEAALANLATNARDAMPKGGRLTIATGNRRLDADYAAHHPEV